MLPGRRKDVLSNISKSFSVTLVTRILITYSFRDVTIRGLAEKMLPGRRKDEISKEPQYLDVWLLQKIIKLITILKLRTVLRVVSL